MAQKQRRKKLKVTNRQDYATQKAIWYKKLESSGFEDAERDEYRLKQYSAKFNQAAVRNSLEAKTEYYSMARRFMYDFKFESYLDKIVWEYHTNGISYRNIVRLLKNVKVSITPNKDNINAIINRLEHKMKLLYLVGYK